MCFSHPFSREPFSQTSRELVAKCIDLHLSLILHQLNTKPNTIKSHKIQGTKLKQLQHFLSWNKANIKHSCKSQLYIVFDPLTPIVMAATGLKRSFNSNTSCFYNLCLFKCIKKYKSKSFLNSLVMTTVKDLSLPKKKLDRLRMKMCKGVCLRRVKVEGLARKKHMKESTIPTICHLSTKCVL